jgi:hypothetical protein
MLRLAVLALILVTTLVGSAWAAEVITGRILRIEQPAGVIVLDDGRMFQVSETTKILVREQPTRIERLQPGDTVAIGAAAPVELRDGQYVIIRTN